MENEMKALAMKRTIVVTGLLGAGSIALAGCSSSSSSIDWTKEIDAVSQMGSGAKSVSMFKTEDGKVLCFSEPDSSTGCTIVEGKFVPENTSVDFGCSKKKGDAESPGVVIGIRRSGHLCWWNRSGGTKELTADDVGNVETIDRRRGATLDSASGPVVCKALKRSSVLCVTESKSKGWVISPKRFEYIKNGDIETY
ncbi:MAG: hypothetical protein QM658_12780 [Gordonia sp. (in: high G+C Gram-positive bacteria)]